jgi:hypothetical protein
MIGTLRRQPAPRRHPAAPIAISIDTIDARITRSHPVLRCDDHVEFGQRCPHPQGVVVAPPRRHWLHINARPTDVRSPCLGDVACTTSAHIGRTAQRRRRCGWGGWLLPRCVNRQCAARMGCPDSDVGEALTMWLPSGDGCRWSVSASAAGRRWLGGAGPQHMRSACKCDLTAVFEVAAETRALLDARGVAGRVERRDEPDIAL